MLNTLSRARNQTEAQTCRMCRHTWDAPVGDCECPRCSTVHLRYQPGPQRLFGLTRNVDIVIYGGAAGGGKTRAELMDPLWHAHIEKYRAVFFRRKTTDITAAGGLWDEAGQVYPTVGGKGKASPNHEYRFPSGAVVQFRHLQYVHNVLDWKGAQICGLYFDQLEEFEEQQFWYLMSRNRSKCGVKPYCRATVNPDNTSFVFTLVGPWVDPESAISAEPGEVLYLVMSGAEDERVYNWFRSRPDAEKFARTLTPIEDPEVELSKSVTFIPATIWDNVALLRDDPGYVANLANLDELEKKRLLLSDWTARPKTFFGQIWNPKTGDGRPWHVVPTEGIPRGMLYEVGVDWGSAVPFAAYLISYDANGRARICREIYVPEPNTAAQGQLILDMLEANRERDPETGQVVEDDGLDPKRITVRAGHDIFNSRRNHLGEVEQPIVQTWWDMGLNVVLAGRDPLTRAVTTRDYLADWGPDDGWPDGRPGLQVDASCKHFIRTLPKLKADPHNAELPDTTMEDHPYDAVGHSLVAHPAARVRKQAEERRPRQMRSLRGRRRQRRDDYVIDDAE